MAEAGMKCLGIGALDATITTLSYFTAVPRLNRDDQWPSVLDRVATSRAEDNKKKTNSQRKPDLFL